MPKTRAAVTDARAYRRCFTFTGCGSHMRIQMPLHTMNGKYMSKGMVVLSGQTTAGEDARFRTESDAARRPIHKKL
jgi:hypothetical protein